MVENLEKTNRQGIVFVGSEGSGKSNHANLVAEKLGLPCISTGQIFRDLANPKNKTTLGEKVRKMFADGAYMDGKTLIEIITDRLSREDTERGFVLDGSLRTLEETKMFHDALMDADRDFPLTVVYLSVPIWESFDRLITGPHPRKRENDTKELLSQRLAKFLYQFKDRIQVIKDNPNWKFVRIESDGTKSEVHDLVMNTISKNTPQEVIF